MILIELYKMGCNVRAQITENDITTNYFEDRKNIEMILNPQSNKISFNIKGGKTIQSENIIDNNAFYIDGVLITNENNFLINVALLMAC